MRKLVWKTKILPVLGNTPGVTNVLTYIIFQFPRESMALGHTHMKSSIEWKDEKSFHNGKYVGEMGLEQTYTLGNHDFWRQLGGHGTMYFPKTATTAALIPRAIS